MSVIKISELTAVETPDLSDVLPVVNQDETKAMTLQQVIDLAKANITILSIKVVNSTTDVTQENILYLVPASSKTGNLYNEYMLINGNVEQVGSQEVDLTGYAKTTDVEAMIDEAITGALEGEY
jgi:hypothetical protein